MTTDLEKAIEAIEKGTASVGQIKLWAEHSTRASCGPIGEAALKQLIYKAEHTLGHTLGLSDVAITVIESYDGNNKIDQQIDRVWINEDLAKLDFNRLEELGGVIDKDSGGKVLIVNMGFDIKQVYRIINYSIVSEPLFQKIEITTKQENRDE